MVYPGVERGMGMRDREKQGRPPPPSSPEKDPQRRRIWREATAAAESSKGGNVKMVPCVCNPMCGVTGGSNGSVWGRVLRSNPFSYVCHAA